MTKRNCIFTGQESDTKDKVIPRHRAHDPHSWTDEVPTTSSYKEFRKDRPPTDLELKAVETFYTIELLELNLISNKAKLSDIQAEINKTFVAKPVLKPKNEGKRAAKKKDKEIQVAKIEKDLQTMDIILKGKMEEKIQLLESAVKVSTNEEQGGLWDE
jgi:hypothetical protein